MDSGKAGKTAAQGKRFFTFRNCNTPNDFRNPCPDSARHPEAGPLKPQPSNRNPKTLIEV